MSTTSELFEMATGVSLPEYINQPGRHPIGPAKVEALIPIVRSLPFRTRRQVITALRREMSLVVNRHFYNRGERISIATDYAAAIVALNNATTGVPSKPSFTSYRPFKGRRRYTEFDHLITTS